MAVKKNIILFILVSVLALFVVVPANSGRTRFLGLCQELVNQARSYENRATFHATQARQLTVRIEQLGASRKNAQNSAEIDRLFEEYDEHRAMERKLKELFRKLSEEADKCMKDSN